MFIKTEYDNGIATYVATTNENERLASISIRDGKYPNYSVIPVITELKGAQIGLLFLLDWMISKVKSPVKSDVRNILLLEYGFTPYRSSLVWDLSLTDESKVVMTA